MEIGLVSAFLGGVLALLSPCSALLLPAFFASTVGTGARLALHGAVFYTGMLVVLVPLGLGAGALGALFAEHRTLIVLVASVLLVALGVLQAVGIGFDPSRWVPGASRLRSATARRTGLVRTVLLGATSGTAGVCAGPILGSVLTLAAATGDSLTAGGLLAVYGAGMVAPLLLVAVLWRRLGTRGRGVLRGKGFTVFGYRLHTTQIATGLLMIGVGILFWTTNGLVSAPRLVPVETRAWLQARSSLLADPVVDVAAIAVVAAAVLGVWAWRRWARRGEESRPAPPR